MSAMNKAACGKSTRMAVMEIMRRDVPYRNTGMEQARDKARRPTMTGELRFLSPRRGINKAMGERHDADCRRHLGQP